MAHFAKINDENIVEKVIVINNVDVLNSSGDEEEGIGVAFCRELYGQEGVWKQTSYNKNMRGNYAGIGMTYMERVETLGVASTDIFIYQKPFESWVVGINTAQWYAPSPPGPAPALTNAEIAARKSYVWNESNYNSNPATAWVLTSP